MKKIIIRKKDKTKYVCTFPKEIQQLIYQLTGSEEAMSGRICDLEDAIQVLYV